jgi:L-alanine-DL-glutamate epimerase-like enolase superfamily enzyme
MDNWNVEITPLNLTPKTPFRISRAAETSVNNVLLTLTRGEIAAYGEAAPDRFYDETPEKARDALKKYTDQHLAGFHPTTIPEIEEIWAHASNTMHSQSALSALDMAMWDYAAKQANKSLWDFSGRDINRKFITSCTIGLGPIDEMTAKVKTMQDYPIVKVKLGTDHDLEIISNLRANYQGVIRVDANCAWDAEKTLKMASSLKKLGVEFIEQPMPPQKRDEMKKVKAKSALPLIADENCVKEEDVEKCVKTFHGINIKLVKCGGITPALRMVDKARKLGLKVMVGCMLESNVGISAGLLIGGLADYIDLDGSWLLKDDPFEGHGLINGNFELLDKPGLGAVLP